MDLEIELLKAKQKIEDLECKLEKNVDILNATRKEAASYKKLLEKINMKQSLPAVHSESLNVSNITITFNFLIRVCMCVSVYGFCDGL